MDAIYFTVISLTTVGFGDYSPSFEGSEETGNKFMGVYRVLVLFWMLIGLAWLGSLLSLTSDKFGSMLTTAFQKVGVFFSIIYWEFRNLKITKLSLLGSIKAFKHLITINNPNFQG